MPVFEIQGPDGKTYELDAPDQDAAVAAFGMMGAQSTGQTAPAKPAGAYGAADSFAAGALDTATFGTLDELGAGASYLINQLPGGDGASYSDILAKTRGTLKTASEEHPYAYTGGQIAGGVGQGIGLVKGGLSLGANIAAKGGNLAKVAGGGIVDGAALGGLQGAGTGEGLEGRLTSAATGAVGGGIVGGAVPLVTALGSTVGGAVLAPVLSRLRPDAYADRAIGASLSRSGTSIDQVRDALLAAGNDGQGMYNVADALGNSGQRMLSTVARTPNDARQGVVEALLSRQSGQGRRLQSALVDGFGSPQTKAQTETALKALRNTEAGVNYGAARASSGSVNPSNAIAKADAFLGTGGSLPATDIAADSVSGAVSRARALLTDGDNVVSDFETAFRSKVELDSMIDNANSTVQAQLIPIRNELDKALEKSSGAYASARDTFRRQSQDIKAADIGREAAMRGRVEDTIPKFQSLTRLEQQSSFRAGYVDPYIETIQGTPGPMTNKARPLISDATTDEFPAFAAPGKAGQLGNRIAREQRMFETTSAALGGSKTADNLADQAELGKFDPSIVTTLLTQGPTRAVMEAVTRSIGEAKGLPPTVVERIAKVLMETRPDVAQQMLEKATAKRQANTAIKSVTDAMLRSLGASATGRLAAP